MNVNDTMSAQDVARYLGIGKNAVYKHAKDGSLPSYRIGRRLVFSLADVDAFLVATRSGSAPVRKGLNPYEQDIERTYQAKIAGADNTEICIAGRDKVGDLISRYLSDRDIAVERSYRNCLASLADVYTMNANAAIVNLYDVETDSYNVEYVKRLLPGVPVVVYRLFNREIGFLVAKGNPKNIVNWESLTQSGVKFVNHKKGTAQRVLADQMIMKQCIDPLDIDGYDRTVEASREAATLIEGGLCDVALGSLHNAAMRDGVDFVALQHEHVDIVFERLPRSERARLTLEGIFGNPLFKEALGTVTGRDCAELGAVVYRI